MKCAAVCRCETRHISRVAHQHGPRLRRGLPRSSYRGSKGKAKHVSCRMGWGRAWEEWLESRMLPLRATGAAARSWMGAVGVAFWEAWRAMSEEGGRVCVEGNIGGAGPDAGDSSTSRKPVADLEVAEPCRCRLPPLSPRLDRRLAAIHIEAYGPHIGTPSRPQHHGIRPPSPVDIHAHAGTPPSAPPSPRPRCSLARPPAGCFQCPPVPRLHLRPVARCHTPSTAATASYKPRRGSCCLPAEPIRPRTEP